MSARHSYAYWTMVWRDINDPWRWFINQIPDNDNTFINPIAARDIAGGIVGGVTSYANGGDPVNGAITGAISASINIVGRLAGFIQKIL